MNTSIKSRYIYLILTLVWGLLTACSDDRPAFPAPDGEKGLILHVPNGAEFKSRAVDDSEELKYTSLVFIAYPKESGKPYIQFLPTDSRPLDFAPTYRPYTLDLPRGSYRFFLIANLWTDESEVPQTEPDLLDALYTLPGNFTCTIPENGLPMSAGHSDIHTENSELSNDADGFFEYKGTGGNLYADMTFLFAKITVNPTDALGNAVNITDVKFSNVSEREPVIFKNGYTDYGQCDITLPNIEESNATDESRTFYIPERYIAVGNESAQTSLIFKIGEKVITLPLGHTSEQSPGEKFVMPEADTHRTIARGYHYKYTLSTPVDVTLEVEDWSPIGIATNLTGPVYLHVEKQEYEVTAGSETSIWFSSDAENVYIASPTYTFIDEDGNPRTLNLYDYSVDSANDTIRVWVNTDIKTSQYDDIRESIQKGEGKYDFFHIVAGPIHKLIKVTPLTLDYYLNVNPTDIPIDVSLRIASGEYSGKIPVSIITNYPEIKVTLSNGWGNIDENEKNALILTTSKGEQVTQAEPSNVTVENGGEAIIYNLEFDGLNSGLHLWKESSSFIINITGIDDEGSEKETVPVTVNIVPLTLNYKIHFKPRNNDWALPHIYVYQCLEFPADWRGTFNSIPLASKPIGYLAQISQGVPSYYAALEYSFTGAIGFRGWNVAVNQDELYYSNGTVRPFEGYFAQGFYIFSAGGNTWKIENQETAKVRYTYEMDFCHEHREYVTVQHADFPGKYCPSCIWAPEAGSVMNRLWPGIMMRPEGDGWYEFELTGIATPGKALIMFADGHGGNSVFRYPGKDEVGIPLFDYPSKEGWLLYNGDMNDRVANQFSPTKPEE